MKKVLVTGAGGFIGSHVVEELLDHGYAVRALVHYNSESRTGNLRFVSTDAPAKKLEIVFGDVCDGRLVQEIARGCEAILHLAALIGIPYSYVAPRSYLETNASGTMNVLEAARTLQVGRVVITSTSEVYGTALYTPIDEAHPLQAQSPYSASKIAADKLTESYIRSFGTPAVILRPFNTYGPRQSARALIPTILSQLISGRPSLSLGNLTPRRDLIFVKDTARGFRLALEQEGVEGQTIHLGTGRAVSVGEIAEMCMKVTGRRVEIETAEDRVRPENSEVGLLLANPERAAERLGWTAQTSLEDGLQRVAEFIRDNQHRYATERYTI